jgi:hypothetical protein
MDTVDVVTILEQRIASLDRDFDRIWPSQQLTAQMNRVIRAEYIDMILQIEAAEDERLEAMRAEQVSA